MLYSVNYKNTSSLQFCTKICCTGNNSWIIVSLKILFLAPGSLKRGSEHYICVPVFRWDRSPAAAAALWALPSLDWRLRNMFYLETGSLSSTSRNVCPHMKNISAHVWSEHSNLSGTAPTHYFSERHPFNMHRWQLTHDLTETLMLPHFWIFALEPEAA